MSDFHKVLEENGFFGGKEAITTFTTFKEFENFCWGNYQLFIRSYSGKLQLLRFNQENIDSIVETEIENKKIQINKLPQISQNEVKQQIKNALISSLILDSHSLNIQLLEQFFGLIFSLNENESSNLFWAPFVFSDFGNKDKKLDRICFEPRNLYSRFKEFYNEVKNSKQPINIFNKKIDWKYVFFANLPFDFLVGIDEKKVKKDLFNRIMNFCVNFENREAYNAWKHRSRSFTGSLSLTAKFNLQNGSSAKVPLYNEAVFWFESNKDNEILQMYSRTDLNENLKKMEVVLTAIFETIKCHSVKYTKQFPMAYTNDPYKLFWIN